MKEMGKLVFRLLIVTAMAGLVLAGANSLTSPVIAKKQEEKLKASLLEVYPDLQESTTLDEATLNKYLGEKSLVQEIFDVKGTNETAKVFRVVSKGGFGGSIEFIVAVDENDTIVGFKVLNHSETPGYGDAATEDFFRDGIVSNKVDHDLVFEKEPSNDYDIQAISGATITTKCILRGLNDVVRVISNMK